MIGRIICALALLLSSFSVATAQIRAHFSDNVPTDEPRDSSYIRYNKRAEKENDMEFVMHLPKWVKVADFEKEVRRIMSESFNPIARSYDKRRAVLHVTFNDSKWPYTYIYDIGGDHLGGDTTQGFIFPPNVNIKQ